VGPQISKIHCFQVLKMKNEMSETREEFEHVGGTDLSTMEADW